MEFKRKVYDKMLKWKNDYAPNYALFLKGARRVGKSTLALKLGKEEYKSFIEIRFDKAPNEIKELFVNSLEDLDYLFNKLQIFYKTRLYPRESLIILDEIQLFPQARQALKTLLEDKRYDFVETGSLASITKKSKDILIPSEEYTIEVLPMDFEEFIWAMNDDITLDIIKEHYHKLKPLGKINKDIMKSFREYLLVGGMPQVILEYINTKSFQEADKIKRDLLSLYRDDIRKHADEINLKVEQIFDTIPSQLQKHEKKFNLANLSSNARFRNYEGAFYWLKDAGLINIAYNTTEPNIGLGQRIDDNSLKCYFFDTGLLLALVFNEREITKEEIYKKILFDKLSFNEGMIMENIIAQTLTSIGRKLYFFSKYNSENANETMEIDFLITKDTVTSKHNIIPIEVKSGDRYTYSSLNKLKDKYKDYIDRPIIIHTKDLKEENGILYLPIYMTCLL